MFRTQCTKKIVTLLTLCSLIVGGVFAPLNTPHANAQVGTAAALLGGLGINLLDSTPLGSVSGFLGMGSDTVIVLEDLSSSSFLRNANLLTQTGFQGNLDFKEQVLDSIFWALGNAGIGNMISVLLQWVNTGMNGNPAFITDFEAYLQQATNVAAGDKINSPSLDALCTPFELSVKVAVQKQLAVSQSNEAAATKRVQCTLEEVTSNTEAFLNGDTFSWAAFFELTVAPSNDPYRAYNQQIGELAINLERTRARKTAEGIMNKGGLDVMGCDSGNAYDGTGTNCIVTTPGSMVIDQLNAALNTQRDRFAFADEFDEVLAGLFSQIANQIFGTNGLLGLGGTSYADANSGFGADGNETFLSALQTEISTMDITGNIGQTISTAIDSEIEYMEMLTTIIDAVTEVEDQLADIEDEYEACFDTMMPTDLKRLRNSANKRFDNAKLVADELIGFYTNLQNATTQEAQLGVMASFSTYRTQRLVDRNALVAQATEELETTLPNLVDQLKTEIADDLEDCDIDTSNTTSSSSPSV